MFLVPITVKEEKVENTSKNGALLQPNYTVTTIGSEALQAEREEEARNTMLVVAGSIIGLTLLAIILLELGLVQSFAKKYASKAPGVLGDLLEYLATRPSLFRKRRDFNIVVGEKRYSFDPLYNYLCLNDYLEMEGMLVKVNSFSMEDDAFKLDLVGFEEGFVTGIDASEECVIMNIAGNDYHIKMPAVTDLIKSI